MLMSEAQCSIPLVQGGYARPTAHARAQPESEQQDGGGRQPLACGVPVPAGPARTSAEAVPLRQIMQLLQGVHHLRGHLQRPEEPPQRHQLTVRSRFSGMGDVEARIGPGRRGGWWWWAHVYLSVRLQEHRQRDVLRGQRGHVCSHAVAPAAVRTVRPRDRLPFKMKACFQLRLKQALLIFAHFMVLLSVLDSFKQAPEFQLSHGCEGRRLLGSSTSGVPVR